MNSNHSQTCYLKTPNITVDKPPKIQSMPSTPDSSLKINTKIAGIEEGERKRDNNRTEESL